MRSIDTKGATVGEIVLLAQLLQRADAKVEEAEAALAVAKENARRLAEEALPGVMLEAGLTNMTLEDGSTVKLADEVYCSISAERKPAAYAWLTEHNFGGLIKTEVVLPFGRDEEERVELLKLRDILTKLGYTFSIEESVHAQTLKAWLKEQLREGADVPLQLFGARPVTVAKVKLPKAKS